MHSEVNLPGVGHSGQEPCAVLRNGNILSTGDKMASKSQSALLRDVTEKEVLAAAAEYDATPDKADFLRKYERGTRSDYMVEIGGKLYPSKAIATAAHGYLPGREPLQGVSGGMSGTAARLAELGFTVSDVSARNPAWSRDELVLALELYMRKPTAGKDDPEVSELSEMLRRLGQQNGVAVTNSYRNRNGAGLKLMNFRAQDPAYTSRGGVGMRRGNALEPALWAQYAGDLPALRSEAARIRRYIQLAEREGVDAPEDNSGGKEGGIAYRMHRRYERDRKLRAKKIASTAKADPNLSCEACGFSFGIFYGTAGSGYAEVHHVNPLHLAESPAQTKLTDLAVLCANCHRMAHRGKQVRSVGEVRDLLGAAARNKIA